MGELAVGDRLGPFRLRSALAGGAPGTRWVAEQDQPRRLVHVRVLPRPEPGALARIRRDLELAGSLQHENVARILLAGEHERAPYVATEPPDGETLDRTLAAGGLEVGQAAELARQLARALAHAHKCGVLHGPIHALDVDRLRRPEGARVRLGGFGCGRGDAAASGSDSREDLRGLGFLLRECLADRAIPADLETILRKLLAREVERRYRTADEVVLDLGHFLRGDPVPSHGRSWGYIASRLVRRRPIASCGVFAAAIASVAIYAWSLTHLARAGAAERVALAETRRGIESSERRARAMTILELGRPLLEEAENLPYDPRATPERIHARAREAERSIREALEVDPDLAIAHHLLGRTLLLAGEDQRAEACWREAIRLEPRLSVARAALARALLVRAIGLWSFLPFGRNGLPTVEAEAREAADELSRAVSEGLPSDQAPNALLAAALGALVRNDLDEARRLAEAGLSVHPDWRGRELFHVIRAAAAPHDAMGEAIEAALRIRPLFPLALLARSWIHLGLVSARGGDLSSALADLDLATRLQSDSPGNLLVRILACEVQGDLAGAREHCEDLCRRMRLRQLLVWRGRLRMLCGDLPAARMDLEEALLDDPSNERVRLGLVEVDERSGDLAGALRRVEEAIAHPPDCALEFVLRARLRLRQGEQAVAIADLDRAIALAAVAREGEAAPLARALRGLARDRLGDEPGAIEDLSSVLALQPSPMVAWLLAGIALRHGNRTAALRLHDEYRVYEILDFDVDVVGATGSDEDLARWLEVLRDAEASAADGRTRAAIGLLLEVGSRLRGAGEEEREVRRLESVRVYRAALEAAPPDWPHRVAIARRIEALAEGRPGSAR